MLRYRNGTSKSLIAILAILALFSQSITLPADDTLPPLDPTESIDARLQKNFSQLESAQAPDPEIQEQLKYFQIGQAFRQEEMTRLGKTEFQNQLERGNLIISQDGYRIELNSVNDVHFIRVIDDKSKKTTVFLDTEAIDPASKHLRQFIARQHMHAEREVTIVPYTGEPTVESPEIKLPIPKVITPQWWQEYWWSIFKKPTRGDFQMSMVCAVGQGLISACARLVKSLADPAGGFEIRTASLSVVFAVLMESFSSTRKNWFYASKEKFGVIPKATVEWAKRFTLSMVFSTLFVSLNKGLSYLDPSTPSGASHLVSTLTNAIFHNVASKAWDQIPAVRTRLRENAGDFEVKLPWKKEAIHINRSNFEGQAMYFVPFVIRLTDLFLMDVKIVTPLFSVPVGWLVYAGSIIGAKLIGLKYIQAKLKEAIAVEALDSSLTNRTRREKIEAEAIQIETSWSELWKSLAKIPLIPLHLAKWGYETVKDAFHPSDKIPPLKPPSCGSMF